MDAWWEAQHQEKQRERLIATLTKDFEQTRDRLEDSIEYGSGLLSRTTRFLESAADAETRATMPLDQLIFLANAARLSISFVPAKSSYESALASGKISLLEMPEFFEATTAFNLGYESYRNTDRIFSELYYRGAIWEMRRELGSLRIWEEDRFGFPEEFRLTEQEMRQVFVLPVVYAAIENARQAQVNYIRGLCQMYEATKNVIAALDDGDAVRAVNSDHSSRCDSFRINPEMPPPATQ